MSRDDYIRNLYGGSSSGSSTSSSDTSSPNYPGNQTYTSTGTPNFGSSVGTSGVGTNVSNIQGPIIDPKADEDAGVYEADKDLFDYLAFRQDDKDENKAPFTSPQDTYASDLNFIGIDPETVENLGLLEKFKDKYAISDETLKFYGVDPANPGYIPEELYQMIAEGSIVTPMESMQSGESGIGSFADLEAGVHPLLGSIDKYYKIMSGSGFPSPTTGGGGGEGIYGGGGGGSDAAAYAMMNQGPKQLGSGEDVLGQTPLQEYMVTVNKYNPYTQMALPNKAKGGIMELVR